MKMVSTYVHYLLKRFQILPLMVLVASDMLVMARVVSIDVFSWRILAAFAFVMAYLFSNRVGDDRRDYDFDKEHYPDRAVQKGSISLQNLEMLGYLSTAVMAVIAVTFGGPAAWLVLPVLAYTWWAKRDFSLPHDFKIRWFFVYNALNMSQMLVLQVFAYVALLGSFALNDFMLVHIAFVFILSLQVEVTRKIKVTPTVANDMYSDRLGPHRAGFLWFALGVISVAIAVFLCGMMGVDPHLTRWMAGMCVMLMVITGVVYIGSKKASMEAVFWLGMIGSYVAQNLVLAYG